MAEDPAVKTHYLNGETHANFLRTRRAGEPEYNILVM